MEITDFFSINLTTAASYFHLSQGENVQSLHKVIEKAPSTQQYQNAQGA